MNAENIDKNSSTLSRALRIVVLANAIVWVCSIIALIFIMQNSSSEKGLFPIMASGLAVALMLVSLAQKIRKSGEPEDSPILFFTHWLSCLLLQ